MPKPKYRSKKDLPMNEVGIRPSRSKGREFIIRNSGRKRVSSVEVGGKTIDLHKSGATVYDEKLAREIKDKYRLDPNVHVIEKDHIQTVDGDIHHSSFSTRGLSLPVRTADERRAAMLKDGWVQVGEGRWRKGIGKNANI